MGGKKSRTKGGRGEREAAQEARDHGWTAHRAYEYGKYDRRGWDIVLTAGEYEQSDPILYIQNKQHKKIAWVPEIVASICKAPVIPLHIWRMKTDRQVAVAVLLMEDFYKLFAEARRKEAV